MRAMSGVASRVGEAAMESHLWPCDTRHQLPSELPVPRPRHLAGARHHTQCGCRRWDGRAPWLLAVEMCSEADQAAWLDAAGSTADASHLVGMVVAAAAASMA